MGLGFRLWDHPVLFAKRFGGIKQACYEGIELPWQVVNNVFDATLR